MTAQVCELACPLRLSVEVWLPVVTRRPTRFRYEVSSEGRVRAVYATGVRVLRQRVHKTGYAVCALGAQEPTAYVHRLVARAFFGPPPKDEWARPYEVDHLDFDRIHNRVVNLRYLPKNVNAWRWKFWTDQPEDTGEEQYEPLTAEQEAQIIANGWPVPPAPKPHQQHRYLGATA